MNTHPHPHLLNSLPKADLPVPHNSTFSDVCYVLLSASVSVCLHCSLSWLWATNTVNPQSHTHTITTQRDTRTDTHKNAITVGESGFGVTFHCLSGSGPRPRQLAPPLALTDFPQLTPSLSTPVVTLQLLSQSPTGEPEWTSEARAPLPRLAEFMWLFVYGR